MPEAIAAAESAGIAPSGSSAMMVTDSLAALSLPAVTPPNLRKSFSLMADGLPAPITISRCALIPSGAGISSADPLLPLNWLAAAARVNISAAFPNAFRVCGPNFSASSQNTTRTPRDGAENGTKPTLTASDISKLLQNSGLFCEAGTGPSIRNILFVAPGSLKMCGFQHYGLSSAALPSAPVAARPQKMNY